MQDFFKIYAEKLSIFLLLKFFFFIYIISLRCKQLDINSTSETLLETFFDFVLRIIPSCRGISFRRNSVWKKLENLIGCIRKINVR